MAIDTLYRMRMEIAQAGFDEDSWQSVLSQLCQVFEAYGAMFWQVQNDGTGPRLVPVADWGDPIGRAAYAFAEESGRQDPWMEGAARNGMLFRSGILYGEALASREDWDTGPWADFEHRFGQNHLLCFHNVDQRGAPKLDISFFRRPSAGVFSPESGRILAALSPELGRAAALMQEFAAQRELTRGLTGLLDYLAFPAWLISQKGHVRWQNTAAEAYAGQAQAILLDGQKLSLPGAFRSPVLGHLFERVLGGTGAGAMVKDSAGVAWRLRFAPATVQEITHIAVFLEPVSAANSLVQSLAEDFGLTESECEVARALCDGKSPAVIAVERGTAISTVRSQLSSVFAKTGTSRQADAIRRLLPYFLQV